MRLLFLVFQVFFACNVFAQNENYATFLMDKGLVEHANAVFRLDEMKIHVEADNKMHYTATQVITVLNKHGDGHAQPGVFYDRDKKIKHIEAFVYDKMGQEIAHIKKKDFQDVSAADGFSLYVDDRLLTYSYTPVQYPYTMKFIYGVETSDTGVFPRWYFLPEYLASVEKSRYEISYASESLKPVIQEYNMEGYAIQKEEGPGYTRYSANKLPAQQREAHSPDFRSLCPQLLVRLKQFHYKGFDAKVDNWQQLGTWVNESLLEGRSALPEATKTLVRNLVRGVDDDLEKARIIHKYVQDNTRYISVQIGIGGLQPISAIEVDRVKYGDCKGLSNYTRALLAAVGVTAYYTVVEAGSRKVDFKEDFADLIQGNHVILAIPYNGQYFWIDCTSQIHPFGFIGDFTDDRKVLVIKPGGGELTSTVAYNNDRNHQRTEASFGITEEGAISGKATITTTGVQYADHFTLEQKSREDVIKYYKDYWDWINNLLVEKYKFENNRKEISFIESVEVSASNYATRSGKRILFAPNAFNKNGYVPKRYRNRKRPLEIQRGFLDEDEFHITLPEGYQVEALPNDIELQTPFGEYTMQTTYKPDTNQLFYKRRFFLKKGLHPKQMYAPYRDFRKKVAAADNAKVVIIANTP